MKEGRSEGVALILGKEGVANRGGENERNQNQSRPRYRRVRWLKPHARHRQPIFLGPQFLGRGLQKSSSVDDRGKEERPEGAAEGSGKSGKHDRVEWAQ